MSRNKNVFLATVASMAALAASNLYAGVGSSGGGNSVVCLDSGATVVSLKAQMKNTGAHLSDLLLSPPYVDQIQNVRSYDLFLAEMPSGIEDMVLPNLLKPAPKQTSAEIIRDVIARVSEINTLGEELNRVLTQEIPPTHWIAAPGVTEIDDGDFKITVPSHCIRTQIAVRRGEQVFYNAFLVRKMAPIDLAALRLHEGLYKIAMDRGQATDSAGAQRVVAMIMADPNVFENQYKHHITQFQSDINRFLNLEGKDGYVRSKLMRTWNGHKIYVEHNDMASRDVVVDRESLYGVFNLPRFIEVDNSYASLGSVESPADFEFPWEGQGIRLSNLTFTGKSKINSDTRTLQAWIREVSLDQLESHDCYGRQCFLGFGKVERLQKWEIGFFHQFEVHLEVRPTPISFRKDQDGSHSSWVLEHGLRKHDLNPAALILGRKGTDGFEIELFQMSYDAITENFTVVPEKDVKVGRLFGRTIAKGHEYIELGELLNRFSQATQ